MPDTASFSPVGEPLVRIERFVKLAVALAPANSNVKLLALVCPLIEPLKAPVPLLLLIAGKNEATTIFPFSPK